MYKFDVVALIAAFVAAMSVSVQANAEPPHGCQSRVTTLVESEYGSDKETVTFVPYWLCRGKAKPTATGVVKLCTLSKQTATTVWASALDADAIAPLCGF